MPSITPNGAPEARYTAARAAWHAGRPWDASRSHRGLPCERTRRRRRADASRLDPWISWPAATTISGPTTVALGLFRRASRSRDCEAIRLMAMTQARLRRPGGGPPNPRPATLRCAAIAPPATADVPCAPSSSRSSNGRRTRRGRSPPTCASSRSRPSANPQSSVAGGPVLLRSTGDVAGTRELLGIETDDRPNTLVADSLLVGIAYYSSGQRADAVRTFERHEAALARDVARPVRAVGCRHR